MTNRPSKTDFVRAFSNSPLLFDGPMGTQLENAGTIPGTPFEPLNLSNPTLVKSVHEAYRDANCSIITANTFAANRAVLDKYGLGDQLENVILEGVRLAREVAEDTLLVAGAVSEIHLDGSPSDHCDAYREQMASLRDARVDVYVLESFESMVGMRLALEALRIEDRDAPIIAQFRIGEGSSPLGRRELASFAAEAASLGADVVGLNCGLSPSEMYPFLADLRSDLTGIPLSAQPSVGELHNVDGRLVQTTSPDAFATFCKRFLKLGVDVVGSCCGTSPEHTRAMSGAIRMSAAQRRVYPGNSSHEPARKAPREEANTNGVITIPPGDRSKFGALLGTEFVVSVEVNPPPSISYAKSLESARRLLEGGATVINTTDGARASLRMDNLAFASIAQRELNCEALLHVCGRDRNILATVSHLMAAHALGVRNLVLITGDPPKMGNFPSATPVYDVDSLKLLEIVSALNRGVDPAGRSMDGPTSFLCGVGVEPAASDFEYEVDRLFRKKEAGADFVMTQPVYDGETMHRLFEATANLDLPILMGVVPLASHRNAEFVHANIPGMRIPAEIRERMKDAGNGPAAREVGVQIAVESLRQAGSRIAGAYIVPPLGLYSSALKIIDELRTSPSQ